MLGPARRHLTTVTVAMVTAAVTAGAPAMAGAIAEYARDADRVDGKHAVSASATREERAGKLVAVNRDGYLPTAIVRNAQNSYRLDGLTEAAFARRLELEEQVGRIATTNNWDYGPVKSTGDWDGTSVAAHLGVRVPRHGALKLEWNAGLWCDGVDEARLRFYIDGDPREEWRLSCESAQQRGAHAKSMLTPIGRGDHIVEVRAVDWHGTDPNAHRLNLTDSHLLATFYPRGLESSGAFHDGS